MVLSPLLCTLGIINITIATDIDIQQMGSKRNFVVVVKLFPPRMTVDSLVEMFPNQSKHHDLPWLVYYEKRETLVNILHSFTNLTYSKWE